MLKSKSPEVQSIYFSLRNSHTHTLLPKITRIYPSGITVVLLDVSTQANSGLRFLNLQVNPVQFITKIRNMEPNQRFSIDVHTPTIVRLANFFMNTTNEQTLLGKTDFSQISRLSLLPQWYMTNRPAYWIKNPFKTF